MRRLEVERIGVGWAGDAALASMAWREPRSGGACGCLRTRSLRGGFGSPSAPTTWSHPLVGWTRAGRTRAKAAGSRWAEWPPSGSGRYGPEAKNRRQWSAGRRARRRTRAAPRHARTNGAPSALDSLTFATRRRKRPTAYPAPQIIRAAERWLFQSVIAGLDPAIHTEGFAHGSSAWSPFFMPMGSLSQGRRIRQRRPIAALLLSPPACRHPLQQRTPIRNQPNSRSRV